MEKVLLTDICDIQYGYAFDSNLFSNTKGKPLVRIRDVVRGYSETYTTEECPDNYIVHDGDILIGMDGEFNIALWKGGEAVLNQRVCKLIPHNKICKNYIFYYMPIALKAIEDKTPFVTVKHLSAKELNKIEIPLTTYEAQTIIANSLHNLDELIVKRKWQLEKLDELVKARFVELFGDPITNSNNLPTERMEQRFSLKAGITTAADDIHDFEEGVYEIPCYGGNGIRGYVKEKSYTGDYPIIGRQGALCGNVQYATGDFHATEHAVLVSLLKDDNSVWVYYLLKLMDLYRYHTGAAQPGLAVKTLNTVEAIVADKSKQEQFAAFTEQTDKSKLEVQKSLEKLELLKKALMQKYFG